MDRNETIRRLREAALLMGSEPPSSRLVQKWVKERLMPPAIRRGRGNGKGTAWIDPPESLAIGTEIIRLRHLGIRLTTALRIHLFLMNLNSDIDQFRAAFISEHDRAIKKLYRGKTYPKDYQNSDPVSSPTISTEAKRLGPIAAIFEQAGFKLPDTEFLAVASDAAHEYYPDSRDQNIILEILSRIFGVSPELDNFPSLAGLLILRDGNDAIPPIDLIQNASDAEIIAARDTFICMKLVFSNFGKLSNLFGINYTENMEKAFYHAGLALESTEFSVGIFPVCIQGVRWLRDRHPGFQLPPEQVKELLQAINAKSLSPTSAKAAIFQHL